MITIKELPTSDYIDIDLGLKYLNGNKQLYLKVLNSFLTRYKDLNLKELTEDELKSTLHTLKGLSATLGMVELSTLAKSLHEKYETSLLSKFTEVLKMIIQDLHQLQTKSLLIIEEDTNSIDTLINNLEQEYDILISTTVNDALEIINEEKIDLIVFNAILIDSKHLNIFDEKNILFIPITSPFNINTLIGNIHKSSQGLMY